MALEKQVIVGKIEIFPDGQMQIREDTIILEDGEELIRTYHRRVLAPGDALPDSVDLRVQAVTNVVWTPEVVSDFKAAEQARIDARTQLGVSSVDGKIKT